MGELEKSNEAISPDDLKVIELVNKHFKEAKKYRDSRSADDNWPECEDFYNGKHWKDKNRSFKNLVFPLVEQEVAVLTDSIPSTDILARKEEREEDAKMLEASIHFTYEQQSLFLKLAMAMRSALKIGTGFHYVDYDPDMNHGQGISTIKTVRWEHVYLDPAATEIDEAAFVGIKFPTRVSELKRRFPHAADKIKASGNDSDNETSSSNGSSETRANYNVSGTGDDKFKIDDMATLEEAWLRDYTMVNIPEEETMAEIEEETAQFFKSSTQQDEMGNQVEVHTPEIPDIGRFEDHKAHIAAHEAQKRAICIEALGIPDVTEADIARLQQEDPQLGLVLAIIDDHIKIHQQYLTVNPDSKKPKYSDNLRLVMKTGNVILYDGNPPVEDGMVPLVPYYCYKDEESIWGTGEVKNILPSQKSFNEMDNAEYESLHLTANPGWIMTPEAGIEPSSISNKRGKVYVVNRPDSLRRLEPGTTSPQLLTRKQTDQQYMEIITGMNEASQGRRPGGITAAKAIERLQQQTNGRIRLKATSLALYSLPRLGKLVASRNAKYWTTERFMRVSDSSSGEVKLVKWSPEQVQDLEYDVRVVPGSLAGTDKESIADAMLAYVEKGLIPAKVYFQTTDVPNKKKILEALEETDQQRMLLEQLAAENEQLKQMIAGAQGIAPANQGEGVPMDAAAMPIQG